MGILMSSLRVCIQFLEKPTSFSIIEIKSDYLFNCFHDMISIYGLFYDQGTRSVSFEVKKRCISDMFQGRIQVWAESAPAPPFDS